MKLKTLGFTLALLFLADISLAVNIQRETKPKKDLIAQTPTQNLMNEVKSIMKNSCSISGCHRGRYPKMMLNLEPDKFLDSVLNVSSQEMKTLKLVDTKNPKKSYLLMKIRGEKEIVGGRMPLDSPPLTEEKTKVIEDWILSLKLKTEEAIIPVSKPAEKEFPFKKPSFWGTRLINLPTSQTVEKGEILFRVSHRYVPKVRSGYYNSFYGLDGPAVILLSLGYGIKDNLMIALGRSKLFQELELSLKWLLFKQRENFGLPFSAAIALGGSWVTQCQPEKSVFRSENFKLNLQLSLSHQINNRLSFLLVPAYSSNTNHWESSSEGTISLGFGGRYMLFNDFSFILEWIPVLGGYKDNSNGWGLGFEKKIGGHVFQVFILNSIGLTSDQFIPGGDLRLKDKDFRIGFNIFRRF